MSDEETKAESSESSSGGKGGGLKMIIIIAVIMVVEGAAVFFLVNMMSGPKGAMASEMALLEGTGEDAPVEIGLVEDERFQNMSTGHVWEWRVEIVLRARQKNEAHIETIKERDAALLKEGVALIFRRAQDRHLREPGLETITRQLTTYINEVFGVDADGMPRVDRVIIPECKGFRSDT